MKILVIDIGGSHVKVLLSGETKYRKADSGPDMTPEQMVEAVRQLTDDWSWDRIAIGSGGCAGCFGPRCSLTRL